MNNNGSEQPDVIGSTPLDVTPATKLSRGEEINERLQAFRQLFVDGENAVLPRFKKISRSAVDRALHVFANINIPETPESKEQLPESDLDVQLLELWELRSGGDEAVFTKMKELYDTYKENRLKYPELKWEYSSWRGITTSTITNLRSVAWLTMDDPTKFDDFLIEKGEWKEREFSPQHSVRYAPASTNAIATFCQALDLSLGGKEQKRPTLLDRAARDSSSQMPNFRVSKRTERSKVPRDFDAEIPDELMPILRRALVLTNAGMGSSDRVNYRTLQRVGDAINSDTDNQSDAALYLLYLHQQAGLIDNPEFRGTVVNLRNIMINTSGLNVQAKVHDIATRYGFKFIFDTEFWKYSIQGKTAEDGQPDILGFELKPIQAKASELKRLGPKRKFNAATSIAQSASRYISEEDEDTRRAKMYADVKQEKEESDKDERKRRRITTQYLAIAERTMNNVFPYDNEERGFRNEASAERGLESFLTSFKDDPTLSPASKALIARIEVSLSKGTSLSDDAYKLNMRAISRDPFLSSAIGYLSDQENYKNFRELSESTDEGRLLNMEFLMRYMAYKILNYTGTERPGSAFILHQEEGDDIEVLSDRCISRVGKLERIKEKDSEREKKFLMQAIGNIGDLVFINYEGIYAENEHPESKQKLRQRLLEMAGILSKEMKFGNFDRAALSLSFLFLAATVILSNPNIRDNPQVRSNIVEGIRAINPFDDDFEDPAPAAQQVQAESAASTQSGDIVSRYEALLTEVIDITRERQIVGQVINTNGITDGQRLGFMPEVIDGFDYIEGETPISPAFMREKDIIERYTQNNGLVLRTTLNGNERIAPIGNRDLQDVIIDGNLNEIELTKDPLQAVTNRGEAEVIVYQVLSPEEDTSITEVDEMKIAAYDINSDFQGARELLATLDPNSQIAQAYSAMVASFENALMNNASQDEFSDLLEQELRIFEENFVNRQYYSLDFEFNSATVAKQLSLTPEQGYDCNAAAVLLLELFQPLGIKVGTISGVTVSNYNGQAWTDSLGHVRVLVGKPDGTVLEVDFTPKVVPGRTPVETIGKLQQVPPDNLSADEEYVAPSHPKSEGEDSADIASEDFSTPEQSNTHQPELVLTITTLLALIGKYYSKDKLISKPPSQETEVETSAKPPEKNIRTACVTNILDMYVPLSVFTSKEEMSDVEGHAMGLLYAAFSLRGDQLKRLNELTENAIALGRNQYPIDSERNEMLEELGTIAEEYRQRLLKDDTKDSIKTRGMPSRRSVLYRLMIDNGWNENY